MNHRTTQENITHCLTLKEFTIQLGGAGGGLNAIVFNSISLCILSTKTMFEMLRDEISINQHGSALVLGPRAGEDYGDIKVPKEGGLRLLRQRQGGRTGQIWLRRL